MPNLHNSIITYKQNAISEIINDPDLVKAIDESATNPESLIKKNIFPYFRVPTLDAETRTYVNICMSYPELRYKTNYMRDVYLQVCIICHQDKMDTEYGATRLDYIAAKMDEIFLNSRKYGFSPLLLLSSEETSLDQFHRCRTLTYYSDESQSKC